MTQIQLKNDYQVDISVLAGGTELIAHPCIVYAITVSSDATGDANVSFADKITTYTNATRIEKAVTTDENRTVQLVYPKGKKFAAGVCAKANKASVDVAITYE
jgi:hypothetical protein